MTNPMNLKVEHAAVVVKPTEPSYGPVRELGGTRYQVRRVEYGGERERWDLLRFTETDCVELEVWVWLVRGSTYEDAERRLLW